MTQKRIRSLDTYTQLAPGDGGYVAPTAVFLAVDSNDFAGEALKQTIDDYLGATHEEKDRLTPLASRSVAITFARGSRRWIMESFSASRSRRPRS